MEFPNSFPLEDARPRRDRAADRVAGLALDPFDEAQGFQRVGTGGGPAVGHVDQAVGRRPGMEVAAEFGAGGGQFGFGTRSFGGDEDEAGIAGAEIGLEVHVFYLS